MKVAEWSRIRAKLKVEFERKGITRCEICNGNFALGFAHRLKRRFIVTDEEKRSVALLCQLCHDTIEFSGHTKMFVKITEVIEKREQINEYA